MSLELGDFIGFRLAMRYPDDGPGYVRSLDGVVVDDFSGLSSHEKEEIGEAVAEDLYDGPRYEPVEGFEKAHVTENGIDLVVRDVESGGVGGG